LAKAYLKPLLVQSDKKNLAKLRAFVSIRHPPILGIGEYFNNYLRIQYYRQHWQGQKGQGLSRASHWTC
jgi:hypothetical protein